jgi:hypothetical protein
MRRSADLRQPCQRVLRARRASRSSEENRPSEVRPRGAIPAHVATCRHTTGEIDSPVIEVRTVDVDALPSAQVEPIAVAALVVLGVRAAHPATLRAESPRGDDP